MKLEMNRYGIDVSVDIDYAWDDTPDLLSAISNLLEALDGATRVDIQIHSADDVMSRDLNEPYVEEEDLPSEFNDEFNCRAVDTNNPAWPFPLDKRP